MQQVYPDVSVGELTLKHYLSSTCNDRQSSCDAGDFGGQETMGTEWRAEFAEWVGYGQREHEVGKAFGTIVAIGEEFSDAIPLPVLRSLSSHLPSTASLEVLVLFSSLTSADPGSIHKTLSSLLTSRIRVSIISLAAELKICRTITEKTQGRFGVAMNEQHYRELIWEAIQAPATTLSGTAGLKSALDQAARRAKGVGGGAGGGGPKPPPSDLMMMGFPTRLPLASPISLCACHGTMRRGGYLCPRCNSKVCEVPTDCEVCGLMVVSSPHLARSYWFLFPVPVYKTIKPEEVETGEEEKLACYGCEVPFPETTGMEMGVSHVDDGVSPTGRYR